MAEGVETANQRLDRFEQLPEKVDAIQNDVEVIKVTVNVMKQDMSFIKNDLKQKVDREEFVALERRVGMVETKFRPA